MDLLGYFHLLKSVDFAFTARYTQRLNQNKTIEEPVKSRLINPETKIESFDIDKEQPKCSYSEHIETHNFLSFLSEWQSYIRTIY